MNLISTPNTDCFLKYGNVLSISSSWLFRSLYSPSDSLLPVTDDVMFLLQARWQRALPSFLSQHSWSTTSRWFVSTSSKRSQCPSETSRPSPDSSVRRRAHTVRVFSLTCCVFSAFCFRLYTFILVFLIFCCEALFNKKLCQLIKTCERLLCFSHQIFWRKQARLWGRRLEGRRCRRKYPEGSAQGEVWSFYLHRQKSSSS